MILKRFSVYGRGVKPLRLAPLILHFIPDKRAARDISRAAAFSF